MTPPPDLTWDALAGDTPPDGRSLLRTPHPSAARVAGVYGAHQLPERPDEEPPDEDVSDERAA